MLYWLVRGGYGHNYRAECPTSSVREAPAITLCVGRRKAVYLSEGN